MYLCFQTKHLGPGLTLAGGKTQQYAAPQSVNSWIKSIWKALLISNALCHSKLPKQSAVNEVSVWKDDCKGGFPN